MQKTNFKTRLLALLTAAFMLVMCVPFAAFAADEPAKKPLVMTNVTKINVYWCDGEGTNGVYKMDSVSVDGSTVAPAVDMNAKEYNYKWVATGKELNVNDTITFSDLLAIAGEPQYDVKADGTLDYNTVIAPVTFNKKDKAVEPVEPAKKPLVMTNVTKINVYWCDGEGTNGVYKMDSVSVDGSTVAPAVDMNAKEYNYKWVATGKELNVNDTITFSDLLAIAGEPQYDVKADGTLDYNTVIAPVTFNKKDKAVEPVEPAKKPLVMTNISKIYVSWYDGEGENGVYKMDPVDFGKTVTAPATDINAERYNYTWNVDELVKNVNDVVTFGELLHHCGAPMYDLNADGTENYQKVVAYVTFVKTDVAAEVGIKNVHFIVKNGEGESWAASEDVYNTEEIFDRTYTVRSDVTGKVTAPAAAVKEGKNFLYWECTRGTDPNAQKYRLNAGAEFNFETLTNLGLPKTESGDFNFVAVFADKKADNSSSSSSNTTNTSVSNTTNTSASNTTNTSASQKQVVKAAAAPANTTKVLPKTGATNAAPLIGGSLAVVALLMGYGVYGLVLRKKD